MKTLCSANAAFELVPGASLLFLPQFPADYKPGSHNAELWRVKEKYRGKAASFHEYALRPVVPFNKEGMWPGMYIDPRTVRVVFDNRMMCNMPLADFVVLPGPFVEHVVPLPEGQNLWGCELPGLAFWPGDTVRFKDKPQEALSDGPRRVGNITPDEEEKFGEGNKYIYVALETPTERNIRNSQRRFEHQIFNPVGWLMAGEDLELISRGNGWALYEDPSKLSFTSDEEELEFWAQDGVSWVVPDNNPNEVLFDTDLVKGRICRRLHECFAKHRERVHALNERLYKKQKAGAAA